MNTVFKALNDPTRRRMLDLLREEDLTAGEIGSHFDMSPPSISHHLEILHRAGLVERSKEGQYVRYRLNATVLDDLLGWVMGLRQPRKKP